MPIYKILLPAEWNRFRAEGRFDGSPFDHASGFVHCSSRAQVVDTARRVFATEPELVVVVLDEAQLDDVRWEPASDGRGTFPHVYGALVTAAVLADHHVAGAALVESVLSGE